MSETTIIHRTRSLMDEEPHRWWTARTLMAQLNCGYSAARMALKQLTLEGKATRRINGAVNEYRYLAG